MHLLGYAMRWSARQARWLLVAGLVAGAGLPELASLLKPWLPELVAPMLFLAAARIGPRAAVGALSDVRATLKVAVLYQVALPMAILSVAIQFGLASLPIATALVLMASAPSIAGSPNLTVLTGHDPAPALRILILGTAILPLTVLPVLWLLPALGTPQEIFSASARLFLVIVLATGVGFGVRALFWREPSLDEIRTLDGVSAIAMMVIVVGLMVAVGPALKETPIELAGWLSVAFAANFGLQILAALLLARSALRSQRVPLAIVAGNRNIALFLAALPAAVTDPILLFIGCYQIPMYLTPILLGRLFSPDKTS